MSCHRCAADPQPPNYGSPRRCAFDDEGNFTKENWSCATIDALLLWTDGGRPDWRVVEVSGIDETLHVIRGNDWGGFIVLGRYKHRGCTSSAIVTGDMWPVQPLTLEIANAWLDGTFWDEGVASGLFRE